MLQRVIWFFLFVLLAGCEPFDLERKNFPVCSTPRAAIGVVKDRLDVTFFLQDPEGTIDIATWDPGDGKNVIRTGSRVTYNYEKAGSYTVKLVLVNTCDDSYTISQEITVTPR
ncbi:PKD domain-containing protein [Spirosoma sp. KUDC1026]|uniref:PKD domain-containing protein n=1 Tax=Spirosoma sp. KUDC1026 TaxID=2745947 RepID=UPI00159B985F|nr:PKD domain-containing protein [Spirosoma sp. KUDC1026]QKZ15141.1 PKD domain-containing protein [Spirosoma sp. KUDC1026]